MNERQAAAAKTLAAFKGAQRGEKSQTPYQIEQARAGAAWGAAVENGKQIRDGKPATAPGTKPSDHHAALAKQSAAFQKAVDCSSGKTAAEKQKGIDKVFGKDFLKRFDAASPEEQGKVRALLNKITASIKK